MIQNQLKEIIRKALDNLGVKADDIHLEHPEDLSNGDFSTNVAMSLAKELKTNPKELAEKIVSLLDKGGVEGGFISKIEIAGPGFINFYLSPEFFNQSLKEILEQKENFGKNKNLAGRKAVVEYTDPNPFKEFHIGHLMSNTIGEAISRLVEWSGAETKRACYQGDVGLHVAKAIWAMLKQNIVPDSIAIDVLGKMYAVGSMAYESDEQAKKEIEEINKKVYERTDSEINKLYDAGRKISLEHFEEIYKKLGTKFDYYFFESETGKFGKEMVLEFLKKGVFRESEGAVIFRGEEYDAKLHTRVFINKEGLPTYEAKELGLAKIKHEKYPYDLSVVITGNEVNDYFKVLLKALEQIFPDLAKKTKHLSHGMLRLPSGKMSSRTGSIITGESLLRDISEMIKQKIESSDRQIEDREKLISSVAVAALKYSILRQSPGKDIIFDFEKSISFEGDSGPYLQYSYARAKSVLEKAKKLENVRSLGPADFSGEKSAETLAPSSSRRPPEHTLSHFTGLNEVNFSLERLLYRFPEIAERAAGEYIPSQLVTYLTELASAFNNFYAHNQIINSEDPETSAYRLNLVEAFSNVLKNGLHLLGIEAPEKM